MQKMPLTVGKDAMCNKATYLPLILPLFQFLRGEYSLPFRIKIYNLEYQIKIK